VLINRAQFADLLDVTIRDLFQILSRADYAGSDPYDLLRSGLGLDRTGPALSFILTQINKRSPVNLRRLLQIPDAVVPKGLALCLEAASLEYQRTRDPYFQVEADRLQDMLMGERIDGYHGTCWGLNFPYANRYGFAPSHIPSSVVTSFAVRALSAYQHAFGPTDSVSAAILDARTFIAQDLIHTRMPEGTSISYTPIKDDCVFNAIGHAVEVLIQARKISGSDEDLETITSCVELICSHQQEDGSWNYNLQPDGSQKRQIDFHQGYICDSLAMYLRDVDATPRVSACLDKGLTFFAERQFAPDGRSFWRYPKQWPVDIHNQTQGMISLAECYPEREEFVDQAVRIAKWTMDNMRNRDGTFAYQKYRWFTNRIPHVRWSLSWTLVAFSRLRRSL